jgi:hypothetical protein
MAIVIRGMRFPHKIVESDSTINCFSAHGSKVGLIAAAHDVALAGDDEPVPLVDRDWFRGLSRCETAVEAWRSALDEMHVRTARVAPLYRAMLAAEADPELRRFKLGHQRTVRRTLPWAVSA